MKKEVWVLVSNGSLAKIFRVEKNQDLVEIVELVHPESRLHERDLVSSKPGRTFDSCGTGRHAMEPQHSQKFTEFNIFARHICDYLDSSREQGKYGRLYIAAGPSFLGLLRQTLSASTRLLIAGEIDKDLTQMTCGDIRENLPPVV